MLHAPCPAPCPALVSGCKAGISKLFC